MSSTSSSGSLTAAGPSETPRLSSSWSWTRTHSFQRLSHWAFAICDADGSGQLTPTELYAGILLVHLELAKYMGTAACYPPSKTTVDALFTASDGDGSGTIDQVEFHKILVICCAQITSRIVVYFALLVLFAKYAAVMVLGWPWEATALGGCSSSDKNNTSRWCGALAWFESAVMSVGDVAETTISLLLFLLVVPIIFNYIDRFSKRAAETARTTSTSTSTMVDHLKAVKSN